MRAPRLHGAVVLPPGLDEARLIAHLTSDLEGRNALVRADGAARIVVQEPTPGRMSVLAFVDGGGALWLGEQGGARTLFYAFTTRTSLLVCCTFSVLACGLAWFSLGDPALAALGLALPLVWLYGANYVICRFRIPAYLGRLCWTVPAGPGMEPPPLPNP